MGSNRIGTRIEVDEEQAPIVEALRQRARQLRAGRAASGAPKRDLF